MNSKVTLDAVADVSASQPARGNGHVEWGYNGSIGPERWADLCPEFSMARTGQHQSPIDICHAKPNSSIGPVSVDYQPTRLRIVNDGRVIRLLCDPGSCIRVDGGVYHLLSVCFHSPSEHLIDGQRAEMELQLLHESEDHQLAALAVLVTAGAENKLIDPLWSRLPPAAGDEISLDTVWFNVAPLLPKKRFYFKYSGSLTTPPCSEPVQWFIFKTPVEMSRAQIDAFRIVICNNVRPAQPLHGRAVYLST